MIKYKIFLPLYLSISFIIHSALTKDKSNDQFLLTVSGIATVLNGFTHCLHEIFSDEVNIDLEELKSSYILTTFKLNQNEKIKAPLPGGNFSAFTLRYRTCLVTTFSVLETWDVFLLRSASVWRTPLYPRYQILLSAEFFADENIPHYSLESIAESTAPPTFLFTYRPRSSVSKATDIKVASTWVVRSIGRHVWYSYTSSSINGFCNNYIEYTKFRVDPDSATSNRAMLLINSEKAGKGYNISWNVEHSFWRKLIFPVNRMVGANPFSRWNLAPLVESTVKHLLSGISRPTLSCALWGHVNILPTIRPDITNALKYRDFFGEIFLTGGNYDYKFITTSTKATYNSNWISCFFEPFEIRVWIAIVVSVLGAILINLVAEVQLVTTGDEERAQNAGFGKSVLWIANNVMCFWPSLFDQPWVLQEVSVAKQKLLISSKTSSKLLALSWLLSALVLNTHYKAVIKSEFIGGYGVDAGINFLAEAVDRNYRITYILSSDTCKKYAGNDTEMTWEKLCFDQSKEIRECQFHNSLTREFFYSESFEIEEKNRIAGKLFHRITYTCIDAITRSFGSLIRTQQPMAFVTTTDEYPFYWNMFQEALKHAPGVQMAGNWKMQDPFLKNSKGYYITAGLHENMHYARNRMQILLHSGIYWFWERWEGMDLIRQFVPDRLNSDYKAVSLQDMKVLGILYFSFIGLLTGFASFSMENIVAWKSSKTCKCSCLK